MGTPGRSSTTAHAYLLPSWNGQHTILTLPHRSAHEHPHVADLGRRIPLWKPPVRRGHQVGRLRSDDNCLVLSPLAAHAAQRWGVWALFGDLSSNRRQPVVVFCLCRPSKRQADDSISGRVAALSSTLHLSWRCERQALIQKKSPVATKLSASWSGMISGPKSPGVAQLVPRHHRTWTSSSSPVGRKRAT